MEKTILFIDENKKATNIFSNVLKKIGYTVKLAYNFELAFTSIKTNASNYNLCILDASSPRGFKESLHICQKFKDDDIYKNIPIFLLTSHKPFRRYQFMP